MKNNRKNRKLKFIHLKNKLRLGITKFYCSEKASNLTDTIQQCYWEELTDTAIQSLYKNYRLKLNVVELIPNQLLGDDFVKGIHTNIVVLSRN